MHRHPTLLFLLLLPALAASALASDFVRDTVPQKWLEPLLPEDLPALSYPAYYNHLDQARAEISHGRYKLALQTLRTVTGADPVQLKLLQGTALSSLGRYAQALAILSEPAVRGHPDIQVLRAEILADTGQWPDALVLLKDHLKAYPDSLAGHYYLGQVSEQLGDLDAAKAAYAWFNDDPQRFLDKWQGMRDRAFDDAAQVVLIGRAIDRHATLSSAYQNNRQLHDTILGMFVRAYDVIDREYWPAHVAAAEYFLSHDQEDEALKELNAALTANPHDIRSLKLAAGIAISNFNFDGADNAIATLRGISPLSPVADLLECRNLMQQRKAAQAQPCAQRVLATQPRNIEALGMLAAVNALQLHDDQTAQILKQVDALDSGNASAYLEVAEQLAALRQYPRSAAMYKIAIARAPWWTAARNGLGLLYTQSGDEDEARTVLDAAHELDPFNLQTTNYLRLLDELGAFARKQTAHFVIFYDGQQDPMIPEYFADYLESIYADVCGQFHHEPAVKTYIEVFPTHEGFSVRTTGSPWIGTVGASTGRVIALVAPRKGPGTMGAFNWSQVLRHEFTHTVTLSATDNRITHWMTEGLAVEQENVPLRWEWVPMLYQAVTKHELFTIDALTWGFIRPRRPIDRQLAYAQSFWICKYIDQKYGRDAILRMLAEFRNGQPQEEVFPKVLGRSLPQFTDDFFAWAQQQVATWGYDAQTSHRYQSLREKGEALIEARQYAQAVDIWEQIACLRPVDALPHQRLAGLYLTSQVNQKEKAISHLVVLHQLELKDNRYAKKIARLYRDLHQFDAAGTYALQAVYIDPYDMDAHRLLAQMYQTAGNVQGLERENHVISVLSAWQEANGRL